MRTIVLVGFPGSGKSTVGKRLSARLSLPFYDTDACFSVKYHISIPDFFSKYGEEFFRVCENSVLKELLQLPPCVISVGGGTPCYFNAMELMNESAVTVYLKLSAKSLFDRVYHSKKERPLLAGKSPEELLAYIETTLPQRECFYEKAQVCVKGENMNVNALVERLQHFFVMK